MRFSFKIFLGLFLIIGIGFYLLFFSFMQSLKPGFRQSTEESLVDFAHLLAEIVSTEVANRTQDSGNFAAAMQQFKQRRFNATIWSLTKTQPNLQVYMTDARGIVIYDSTGQNLGADFSRWNDVHLTLHGGYGVRSSLQDPDNPLSTVMHVAAPIYRNGELIGVLTVKKPNLSVEPLLEAAQHELTRQWFLLLLLASAAGIGLSIWLSRSLRLLADYAKAARAGRHLKPPKVYGIELQQLATAMEAMKTELEGKQYVEHYVQTLAHQLKTPLASIVGAAELLNEDMERSQRLRFIGNIEREARRLQQIVEHMLRLADIENRQTLSQIETIDLANLISEALQSLAPAISGKELRVTTELTPAASVQGEHFLLLQALINLIDNAIAFSPPGGTLVISAQADNNTITLAVRDDGPGIPEFARARIFERFYSLPRPHNQRKSSGLGLCFVTEIARLHGGEICLVNRDQGGAEAILTLHKILT